MWHPGFCHFSFSKVYCKFGLKPSFWINSFGLSTWVLFWFSRKWLHSLPETSLALISHNIAMGIFFSKAKYWFPFENEWFSLLLQSNPYFSCPQKSEKIPKYSLDHASSSYAKIYYGHVEYFFSRKSFLSKSEMVLREGSIFLTIFLTDLLELRFL